MRPMLYAIVAFCVIACDKRSKLHVERNNVVMHEVAEVENTRRNMRVKTVERHLIKKGSIDFQTNDWKIVKQQMAFICDSLGAYAADESLSNFNDRISYHQVLRVPSDRFEELVAKVERLSGGLLNKSINVDDVTEEYIDIEVRIRNKKEMESRYLELLKKANKVTEMLDIERYISDVRTDIESMEGKLKYLQDRISFSTLEVTFYEKVDGDYGFGSRFASSLSNGWENLLVVIIAMANIWPFIILLAAIAFWLKRRSRPKAESRLPNTVD